MNLFDIVLIGLLMACAAFVVYYIFKAKIEEDPEKDIYTVEYLCEEIKSNINNIINMDLDFLNLNKKDLENRKLLKRSLSDAVRKCSQGDLASKMIVTARIKSILTNVLDITDQNIDMIIPFNDKSKLKAVDKFEILMYLEKLNKNKRMFNGICKKTGIDKLKKEKEGYYYKITSQDIDKAYEKLNKELTFDDKLNILTQRIYQETYGLSIVDMMIMEDDSLDGISGGVSGITIQDFRYIEEEMYSGIIKPGTHASIWITYEGKSIHLEFLSFKSKSELIRICKNMAEHGRTGHITSSEGGIKTHLANGSRVTVFRPNNSSSWCFFVRKFGNTKSYSLEDLITDKGNEYPINIIKWAVKGCLNIFFSGDQNSGKTTNLRAAVKYIDKRQSIRTLEADFELNLNNEYAEKNIIGVRPSEKLPFDKVIELLKSTEAHTIILGETASLEHAKHSINLLLAGTKRVMTTGHWQTAKEMVAYHVHALGGYGQANTREVEEMVSRLTHLFIHCVKENDGHRHIQKITEIIPYEDENIEIKNVGIEGYLEGIMKHMEKMTRKYTYYTRDLVVYKNGRYEMVNPFSERLTKVILYNLPDDEREEFLKFNTLEGNKE